MRKSRLIAFAVALAMVLSWVVVPESHTHVHAVESGLTLTVGDVEGKPGDTVKVPVTISNNPGLFILSIRVQADAAAATMKGSKNNAEGPFAELTFMKSVRTKDNSATLYWESPWFEEENDGNGNYRNYFGNGVIGYVEVTIDPDAAPGVYPIHIMESNDKEQTFLEAYHMDNLETVAQEIHREAGTIIVLCAAHDFGEYVSNGDATCSADGTKTRTCKACGQQETVTDTGSMKDHAFITYIFDDNADCTTDGTETAKCAYCDVTDTRTAAGTALGHTFGEYVSDNNAACEQNGTETAKCVRCDVTDTRIVDGTALGHTFGEYESDKNATCAVDGTETAECTVCGQTHTRTEVGSHENAAHSFPAEYVSDGNATCTADGTMSRGCTVCGEKETVTEPGSAKGHTFTEKTDKYLASAADCCHKATYFVSCADCGEKGAETFEMGEFDLNKHTGATEVRGAVAATEEQTGYTGDTVCVGCDTVLVKGEIIPVLDHTHNMAKTEGNEATCESEGNIAYWTCTKCGKLYADAEGVTEITAGDTELAALGHSFTHYVSNGKGLMTAKCDRCDVTRTVVDPHGDKVEIQGHHGIGKDLLQGMVDENKPLHVVNVVLNMTFDADALAALMAGQQADDIKFTAEQVKHDPENGRLVYDLSVWFDNEKQIGADFGNGTVTVSIPLGVEALAGQIVHVWYVDAHGNRLEATPRPTTVKDGNVIFTTNHFSYYEVEMIHEHTFGEWTVTSAPTCENTGLNERACIYCGETETNVLPALGHAMGAFVSNGDATCVADGTETSKCSRCDKSETRTAEGTKQPHSFTAKTDKYPAAAADCCHQAAYFFSCAVCGEKGAETFEMGEFDLNKHNGETEVRDAVAATEEKAGYTGDTYCLGCNTVIAKGEIIPVLDHTHAMVKTEAKEASCQAEGNITYWTCIKCDKLYSDAEGKNLITLADTVIPALGHSYTTYTADGNATCEADGTETAKCDRCDVTDTRAAAGSALGHAWGEWTVTTAPTCETAGEETRTCAACGKTETKSLAALGHDMGAFVFNGDAACEADGTETSKCSRCDKTETRTAAGTALGHAWGEWTVTTAPTCETAGEETRTCAACGKTETKSLAALGHDMGEFIPNGDATCEENGTETSKCRRCDKSETRPATDSTLGHAWGEWTVITAPTCETAGEEKSTCSNCGKTESKTIAALGHAWGEWTVITAPTCETAGEETRSCGTCGKTETKAIEALGHDMGAFVSNNDATCEADGTETAKCGRCDKSETRTVAGSALGHAWGEWTVTTAPTCETAGEENRSCGTCGKTETKVIEALGHAWTQTEVIAEATCTENGEAVFTCDTCALTENRTLEAKGHNYESVVTDPTATDKGYTTHTCACGDSYVDSYVDPVPETPEETKPVTPDDEDDDVPETGDETHITLWAGVLLVAMMGTGALVVTRKKWIV